MRPMVSMSFVLDSRIIPVADIEARCHRLPVDMPDEDVERIVMDAIAGQEGWTVEYRCQAVLYGLRVHHAHIEDVKSFKKEAHKCLTI